jgi:hypothetical protein
MASFGLDEMPYTLTVKSTGSSNEAAAAFKETPSVRRFFPIIIQLWMTAVLFVFVVVRVLDSGTVRTWLHRWAFR